jgi:thiamine monophosphate synthase
MTGGGSGFVPLDRNAHVAVAAKALFVHLGQHDHGVNIAAGGQGAAIS